MDIEAFPRRLWGFLHLRDDAVGFQAWVAKCPELESLLGADLYRATITFQVNTPEEYKVHDRLEKWAQSSPVSGCPCATWSNDERVFLGYETATLVEDWFTCLKERNPWLRLVACSRCGQRWYLAIDTVDDDQYFVWLSDRQVQAILENDEWPTRFDDFKNVWPDPKYTSI